MVTGKDGQLGYALQELSKNQFEFLWKFTDRSELDITDSMKIQSVLKQFEPDWIINAAAYTDVDAAESNEEIAVNSSKTIEVNLLSGKYYIISGSFSNYNLSLNKANFLNDNGFNAFIISPVNQNKMFRVAVDVYDDIDTAKENLKSYKEKLNNELWILKY